MTLISRLAERLSRWRQARHDSPPRIESGPVISTVPESAQSQLVRGVEHYRRREYDQAILFFEAAIEATHDFADAHYHLGLALYQLGRFEDAADAFGMALCFAPTLSRAQLALAHAENMQGKSVQALSTLELLLERESDVDAWNLRGTLLLERGDVTAAIASFEAAVGADPNSSRAHGNLGYVLFRELGDYDRGTKHIERALEIDPENEDAQCNYSMILSHYGQHERALRLCDQLLSSNPGMHEARLNRALALLHLGRYEQAWDDYEARKLVRSNYRARSFPCPEWQGEDLSRRRILVHGEQGLGDEIMFASCFQDVIGRAGHCIIECEPRMVQLFKRSFADATVVPGTQSTALSAWWTDDGGADVHVAAGSLPRYFRRSISDFPVHGGYLKPAPERVAYWRWRLGGLGPGLKVGISWRGGMPSTRRGLRSIDLAAWGQILRVEGVHFVSLQYGDTRDELQRLVREQGVSVHSWQEAIDDLDEAAALVSALDLVISVCTAVVHLAGAMARPVWVLVPASSEWRYQASGERMPWYPSARLFRQSTADDWSPLLRDVEEKLRTRARLLPGEDV